MLSENYEQIEAIFLNLALIGLFLLMSYAVHDVLKKNDVPAVGKVVVYLVLFLGAAGFIFKGIVQLVWQANGVAT
jgi:small neutral amino acid transporter SnatA (MarC family)